MRGVLLDKPAFIRFENPLININFLYDQCDFDAKNKVAWIYRDGESIFYVDGKPAFEFFQSAIEDLAENGGVIVENGLTVLRQYGKGADAQRAR